jgi:hypothetical protein
MKKSLLLPTTEVVLFGKLGENEILFGQKPHFRVILCPNSGHLQTKNCPCRRIVKKNSTSLKT